MGTRIVRRQAAALVAAALLAAACGGGAPGGGAGAPGTGEAELAGTIRIDGSSTVYPISAAVAEEFMKRHPGVNVTVGVSGTGGGFQKFARGEIEIANASRPIKDPERAAAQQAGIAYVELAVAIDGIAVVVHPGNDWVDHLTVEELRRIWGPGSAVRTWRDVRPGWPDRPIKLYGPGPDSGTFDYFTEAVVGEARAHRSDYTASEDDNVLVVGVSGDRDALGYFGYAYYEENRGALRAVPVDAGQGPVAPTPETLADGRYAPLSRPIFIYVDAEAYRTRPEVRAFVDFYLDHAQELAREVGYVPLPDAVLAEQRAKLEALR